MGDSQIIDSLEDCLTRLTPMREHVLELAGENRNEEAAAYMESHNILVIQDAQKELDKLVESGNRKGMSLMNDMKDRQVQSIIILAILGVVSLIVSIGFCIIISRKISRGIKELEQAALDISNGQFSSTNITYESGMRWVTSPMI